MINFISFQVSAQTNDAISFIRDSLGYDIDSTTGSKHINSYIEASTQVKTNGDSATYLLAQALYISLQESEYDSINYVVTKLSSYYNQMQDIRRGRLVTQLCIDNQHKSSEKIAYCYSFRGRFEILAREADSAAIYIEKSIEKINDNTDPKEVASIYNNKGNLHILQNQFDEAISAYLKCKEYSEIAKDSLSTLVAYGNLANLYYSMNNHNDALSSIEKAISYLPKEDIYYRARILKFKAMFLFVQEQYAETIDVLNEVLEISTKTNYDNITLDAWYKLAYSHFKLGVYSKAQRYIDLCNQVPKAEVLPALLFRLNLLQSKLKYYQNQCEEAFDHLSDATSLLEVEGEVSHLQDYHRISILVRSCVKADSVGFHLSKFEYLNDSLDYKRRGDEALEIVAKYQLKSSQDSISILNLENELQASTIKKNRTYLLIGLISVFLLISLVLLLFNRHKFNRNKLETQQQKLKLYTNIAHELQTPLTIISGVLKNLLQLNLKEEPLSNSLHLIRRNTDYLLDTTKQILTLSRIDQVDLITEKQVFRLQDFLSHILEGFDTVISAKNIKASLPDYKEPEVLIDTDIDKLSTVFKNIITNAIKYLPSSSGTLSFQYDARDGFHNISIEDNGTGIDKKDLGQIFDRFYQANERNNNVGGFGIGLAICKEYIELLGGEISVESTPGVGTSFTIKIPKTDTNTAESSNAIYEFPRTFATTPTDSTREENLTPALADTPRILIVEDNLDLCQYLKSILAKDYHLKYIYNGEDALEYLKNHQPDLIITDWMMPKIDGIQLVEQIKRSDNLNTIPILMLTARTFLTDKIKAIRVGVDDYLQKPFDSEELKSRIAHLVISSQNKAEGLLEAYTTSQQHSEEQIELSSKSQLWLLDLEKKLISHLDNPDLGMKEIAEMTDYSVSQISRKIKEFSGLTGKRYVRELRLWQARYLLETRKYQTVKEVIYAVGFKDHKYFARIFKDRFGKSPSQYHDKFKV